MGLFDNFNPDDYQDAPTQEQDVGEIERGAWENLFVSMERSFYNIVDLAGTSVRKLSTFSFEEGDPRKKTGIGWIGQNAGKIASSFRAKADDPSLAPETDPEMMDKFAELLGTTVPYTVAALAGGAVSGGAGLGAGIGAAVSSFAIMREDAYRSAIDTGATHDEANTEALIVGGINAVIEMAQIGGILRQSKTGGALLKAITLNARNKAWMGVLKSGKKLTMGMVRNAAEEALEEALQGTVSEIVPKILRGKEIEGGAKGFAARRAREAGAGALIGGVFSGLGQLGTTAMEAGKAYIPARQEIESMQGDTTQTGDAEDLDRLGETSDVPVDEDGDPDFGNKPNAQGVTGNQAAAAVNEGLDLDGIKKEIEPDTRTPFETAVDKIKMAVKRRALGKVRATTEQQKSVELAKRTQKADAATEAALKEHPDDFESARRAGAAELAGTLPEALFDEITQEEMTEEDWGELTSAVWGSERLQVFEKHNADRALKELQAGIVPTPSNLAILGKVVGKDVAAGMKQDLRTESQKRWDILKDILNIPSTLLTTFDNSLMGRQGLLLLANNPKAWGKMWVDSTKAFFDFFGGEDGYTAMYLKELNTRDGAIFAEDMGLAATSMEGGFTEVDERFMSNIAKKIPLFGILVRASERAAVLGMNGLRAQVFDNTVREWKGTGKTTKDYKELANIINISSGIGKIDSKKIKAVLPFLTAVFFAPKYVKSRFDILGELGIAAKEAMTTGQKISPARKILVKQMTKFVAGGMMAMFLRV